LPFFFPWENSIMLYKELSFFFKRLTPIVFNPSDNCAIYHEITCQHEYLKSQIFFPWIPE